MKPILTQMFMCDKKKALKLKVKQKEEDIINLLGVDFMRLHLKVGG
jgi:hypothetical protein